MDYLIRIDTDEGPVFIGKRSGLGIKALTLVQAQHMLQKIKDVDNSADVSIDPVFAYDSIIRKLKAIKAYAAEEGNDQKDTRQSAEHSFREIPCDDDPDIEEPDLYEPDSNQGPLETGLSA